MVASSSSGFPMKTKSWKNTAEKEDNWDEKAKQNLQTNPETFLSSKKTAGKDKKATQNL